jgi:hypothetical protein
MDILDRTLERSVENAQIAISSIIAEKGELSTEVAKLNNLPQITIKDRDYLETRSKNMIGRCENILNMLDRSFERAENGDDDEEECEGKKKKKKGVELYAIDVYSKLVNAVAVQIRELRELNKMVMGIDAINAEQVMKKMESENEGKSKEIKMTSSDLLKLIKEASKKDALDAVDAEFHEVKPEKELVNEPA